MPVEVLQVANLARNVGEGLALAQGSLERRAEGAPEHAEHQRQVLLGSMVDRDAVLEASAKGPHGRLCRASAILNVALPLEWREAVPLIVGSTTRRVRRDCRVERQRRGARQYDVCLIR